MDSGQVRQSKGFAFIKFKDLEAQEKVLLTRHMILDRWCDVKVTEKNEKKKAKGQLISECLFDFLKYSKKSTKNLTNLCPRI